VRGEIDPREMLRTFNMGVGMVLVVAEDDAERVRDRLQRQGEATSSIGEVVAGDGRVRYEGLS
jgi:phosphoribosylformylglycinamidine cyclo-ligase